MIVGGSVGDCEADEQKARGKWATSVTITTWVVASCLYVVYSKIPGQG
jgi:hypothetical protein